MRRISEVKIRNALKNTPIEDRLQWERQDRQWPPESFDSAARDAEQRAVLVARLAYCACLDGVKDNARELVRRVREQFGDVIPEDLKALSESIKQQSRIIAKEYSAKRKCHADGHELVCYCDEHSY